MSKTKMVTIYEDWANIEGAIWYKWKLDDETEWHWKRTAYKEKPIIQMKRLTEEEFRILYINQETPNE